MAWIPGTLRYQIFTLETTYLEEVDTAWELFYCEQNCFSIQNDAELDLRAAIAI